MKNFARANPMRYFRICWTWIFSSAHLTRCDEVEYPERSEVCTPW